MNANHRVKNDKPESITNVVMLVLGPVVVTLSLIVTAYLYKVNYDGAYVALAVITFLVSFIVLKEIELHTSWRSGGVSAQSRAILFALLVFFSILLFM